MNFCFIGCGRVAHFHAQVIRALGHRIVAATARPGSPNLEPFRRTHEVEGGYHDWPRMLAAERPDAVVVATPWNETQNLLVEVVEGGVPCLVEKPVALDAKTLEQVVSETSRFHHQVFVGYNRRFYESVQPIRAALEEWRLVSIELNLPEATGVLRGTYTPEIFRHMLVYMSSHWFDLLRWLVGDVSVLQVYGRRAAGGDHETAYNGLLWSTRHGVPIHLQSNFDAPSRMAIAFNFEDRIYRLSPIETLTVYRGLTRERSASGRVNRYIPGVEQVVHADDAYKPGFYRQMENFIEAAVRKTASNAGGCTLEEALQVMHLVEEIQDVTQPY